jgi:hypothetical protein
LTHDDVGVTGGARPARRMWLQVSLTLLAGLAAAAAGRVIAGVLE